MQADRQVMGNKQNENKLLLNMKYAYYYLYHNLDMMKQLYTGVGIKNISKTNIEGIKIPIPSLSKQQEIVNYLDFIYEKTNKTSQSKIEELKLLNEYCLNNQKLFGANEVITAAIKPITNKGVFGWM
jgi:restriction endonuclease S subunit